MNKEKEYTTPLTIGPLLAIGLLSLAVLSGLKIFAFVALGLCIGLVLGEVFLKK